MDERKMSELLAQIGNCVKQACDLETNANLCETVQGNNMTVRIQIDSQTIRDMERMLITIDKTLDKVTDLINAVKEVKSPSDLNFGYSFNPSFRE